MAGAAFPTEFPLLHPLLSLPETTYRTVATHCRFVPIFRRKKNVVRVQWADDSHRLELMPSRRLPEKSRTAKWSRILKKSEEVFVYYRSSDVGKLDSASFCVRFGVFSRVCHFSTRNGTSRGKRFAFLVFRQSFVVWFVWLCSLDNCAIQIKAFTSLICQSAFRKGLARFFRFGNRSCIKIWLDLRWIGRSKKING